MDQEIIHESRPAARFYPQAFKQAVVREYLSSGLSKEAIKRKYDIRSHGALLRWLQHSAFSSTA